VPIRGSLFYWIFVEKIRKIWYNTNNIGGNDSRQQREGSGEPHVLVSADTRKKQAFGKQCKVLSI